MKPILIQWSNFTLYSYPLFIGIAWGLAFRFSEFLLYWQKKDSSNLKWFYSGIFLSSWLGAKLLFLLASSKDNFQEYLVSSNFWLGGGFVFYGGLIGGALFSLLYSGVLKKFSFENVLLILPSLTFAHAVGRIGCFLAGCCYGKESDLFFSIHMHGLDRHPVQLYECFALIALGMFMLKLIKEKASGFSVLRIYIIGYGLIRFALEFMRGDLVRGLYFMGLSTSQLISIGLVFLIAVHWIYSKKRATQQ